MKEKTPLKKYIILLIIATIVLFLILFFLLFRQKPEGNINCVKDEQSGETICSTDYEKEIGDNDNNNRNTIFIGLSFLDDYGYSNSQQDIILSELKSYFSKYDQVNYEKDSFKYEPIETETGIDFSKASFKLTSNTSEYFIVHLNTKNSIASISVFIEKAN
ncbi:MAG: hypothetical protein Q4A25_00470 [Candidatus Saccharibacteria bacterium]|nr:hypothetical protein [Candidatus Saccharibacteria bacterium]